MAKRKVAKTRAEKKPAKKRAVTVTSKRSRGGSPATRKKKVARVAKVKKTKQAVKKKATAKSAESAKRSRVKKAPTTESTKGLRVKKATTAKSAKRSRVKKAATTAKTARRSRAARTVASPARAKKVKAAAKTAPKRAGAVKRNAASPDASPAPSSRVSLQWGPTTIELVEEAKKIPKTKLTKKELREFAAMLLAKRRELVGDMENLGNEAINSKNGGGRSSSVPLHMADVGTDNWEQEFTLGLIENERGLVQEIDEALARVEARTYGICLATHTPIDKARLRAKPWAKYCIEYARLRELGRVP